MPTYNGRPPLLELKRIIYKDGVDTEEALLIDQAVTQWETEQAQLKSRIADRDDIIARLQAQVASMLRFFDEFECEVLPLLHDAHVRFSIEHRSNVHRVGRLT